MKTRYLLYPFMLLMLFVGYGCGSTTTDSTTLSQPDTVTQSAQKGSVTFSVKFPASGASKALIDPRAQSIRIYWNNSSGFYNEIWLNAITAGVDGTVTTTIELTTGTYTFNAEAYDAPALDNGYGGLYSNGNLLGMATTTVGTILSGANNVKLAFLSGEWRFKDASGANAPITLNGGEVVHGFALESMVSGGVLSASAKKSTIDSSKPLGYSEFFMRYIGPDQTANGLSSDDFYGSSTDMVTAYSLNQFLGGASAQSNQNAFNSNYSMIDRNWGKIQTVGRPGDRLLTIAGFPESSFPTEIAGQFTTTAVDGSTMTGNLLEMIWDGNVHYPGTDAGMCGDYPMASRATSANIAKSQAIQSALSGVKKSAFVSSSVIGTWDSCVLVDLGLDLNGNSQVGDLGECTYNEWDQGWQAYMGGRYCSDWDSNGVIDYGDFSWRYDTFTESFSNIYAHPFVAKGAPLQLAATPSTIVTNQFVQYRNYEDATKSGYLAWIDYKNSGSLMQATDFVSVTLTDPNGATTTVTDPANFISTPYIGTSWNPASNSFNTGTYTGYSGWKISLGTNPLPTGIYTYTTALPTATLTSTANYPSNDIIPFVSSLSMNAHWNPDGSLTLSWTEPTGAFNNYQVVLHNPNTGREVFYGYVPTGVSLVTLSSDMINEIKSYAGLSPADPLNWVMQTRSVVSYNGVNQNYARGYSNPVAIPPQGLTTSQFVQYRNYEDATKNGYYASIDYKNNGSLISSSDLSSITLRDPAGVETSITSPALLIFPYIFASFTDNFTQTTYQGYSGYRFSLGTADIPTGIYTFVTDTQIGSFNATANYPSNTILPFVTSASMNYLWNPDGSLTLSWAEPAGTFGTYRITFINPLTNIEIFYGAAPPGTNQVTFSATLINQIRSNAGLSASDTMNWVMQTRNYVLNTNQQQDYARSYSNSVAITPAASSANFVIR